MKSDFSIVRGWVWEFSTIGPPPPPPTLVNGDIETGNLSGWYTLAWAGAKGLSIDGTAPLSGTHALTTGTDAAVRAITQDTGSFTKFEFSMLFRIEGLGSGGTPRAMDWNLSHTAGGNSGGDLRYIVNSGGIFINHINEISGSTALLDDTARTSFVPTAGTTYRWEDFHFGNGDGIATTAETARGFYRLAVTID